MSPWWLYALTILTTFVTILLGTLFAVQNGRVDQLETTVAARGERIATLEANQLALQSTVEGLRADIRDLLELLRRHTEQPTTKGAP